MELVTGGNSEELGLCPYDFQNIGLNYCAHARPVRQVVARLKVVRAVQGHRGGERGARIARSSQATDSHARAERRTAIQGPLVSYNFVRAPPDCLFN